LSVSKANFAFWRRWVLWIGGGGGVGDLRVHVGEWAKTRIREGDARAVPMERPRFGLSRAGADR